MPSSGPYACGVGGDRDGDRRDLMRACAGAAATQLAEALGRLGPLPSFEVMRVPEIGLVMLRGRAGGDGATFNIGEATVTRAAVRLSTGETGFGFRLGRSLEAARLSAVIDALWQAPAWKARIEERVLGPLSAHKQRQRDRAAEETAATKVDFFTLVRGEE
jgi:alpha-D-ribose 1-methylphosphonate 5-triphosphate synthase subunit PhnG